MEIYFETLNGAIVAALSGAIANAAELDLQEHTLDRLNSYMNYEETKEVHCPILAIKGKPTKKWYHIVIYRMSSGRYELTNYIL